MSNEVLDMPIDNHTTWRLPFGEPAELELHSDCASLTLVPLEAGGVPRLELTRGSAETIDVQVEQHGQTVWVRLDPRGVDWFGDWECRATLYVPDDIRAKVQTNAGRVSVRDLRHCELAITANAGKIDLVNVYGRLHLRADAGSVTGQAVGGSFDVETHAGSVRLDVADLQPGEHHVRASLGSVRLALARGVDAAIESHTSLGSVRNTFPSRASAAARLVVSTEMGSVRVEEAASMAAGGAARARAPEAAQRADPELERILKMVEAGDLSAQDADDLLRAMGRV